MKSAGLAVEAKYVSKADLDAKVYRSAGHFFGTTEIVLAAAEKYLQPSGAEARHRPGPSDFQRREAIRYRTPGGEFVISYAAGFPVGHFDLSPLALYLDHANLLVVKDAQGNERPVKTKADWAERVAHIRAGMQQAMGPLPEAARRVPLDVETVAEERTEKYLRRKVRFTPERDDRVPAWLMIPNTVPAGGKAPAMLCLHQTTGIGKNEPAGLGGLKSLHYAHELAERGYVCLVPDYPSFGEYPYDFKKQGAHYASGSMKAIWNNLRAVDLLEALPQVDGGRLGVIGHSLGGHNALFTAVFDERLRAVVSSCGFTPFHDYYGGKVAGWTSDRYMPRIRDRYGNNADQVPFDFYEILGALAPRAFFSNSPVRDSNFDIGGVRKAFAKAGEIYALHNASAQLKLVTPDAPHDFPEMERKAAYAWLDEVLK
ncbi:MAG: alpha/beta fold hydrolase [Proteobacteria bacterium]|nr:alpha/beta fold hydrolase [Pseudomonadota bacterium]